MDAYLYLDTETTGLGPEDCAYQVAWAFEVDGDVGQIEHAYVHLPAGRAVSDYTLASSAYKKYLAAPYRCDRHNFWTYLSEDIAKFKKRLDGDVYLVGANPAFDDRQLRKMKGGQAPGYHHRLIDVEAYDMALRGAAVPRGLADIARDHVPDFDGQDHEARSDVRVLIAVFHALQCAGSSKAILPNRSEISHSERAFRAAEERAGRSLNITLDDLKPLQ